MKVALVYDRVNKWGGAERVLISLRKIFPNAHLFTSVYNPKKAKWAKGFKVKTSFLQDIPYASNFHELLAPLMPVAFYFLDFSKYDLVISVTSEYAKVIRVEKPAKHISYILTPTRYLWSGYKIYFKNNLLRVISLPIVWYLRIIDKYWAKKPDKLIGISTEVNRRIKKYYKKDAKLIFPPLDISKVKIQKPKDKDYFLVVSRLVYYKRVDLAVRACTSLNLPLVVVGTGGQEKSLKKIAGPSVKFVKNISDGELYGYYKNSKALIFPGLEDFGIVMTEAQYFGKPVIAFKGGGALDIIIPGKTGEFFTKQKVKALKTVLEKFNARRYNYKSCRQNALRFSFTNFKKLFLREIKEYNIKL